VRVCVIETGRIASVSERLWCGEEVIELSHNQTTIVGVMNDNID
jgi:hypothetical protein